MSNPPEGFEQLQKLLKLKRYEAPPPGYFNNFSSKVVSRIEAENGSADIAWRRASWFRKIMLMLETNAIAAGLFGASVCGLLISGISYSQSSPSIGNYLAAAPGGAFGFTDGQASAMPATWAKTTGLEVAAPSISPMFTTNVPGGLLGMGDLNVQKVSFELGQ